MEGSLAVEPACTVAYSSSSNSLFGAKPKTCGGSQRGRVTGGLATLSRRRRCSGWARREEECASQSLLALTTQIRFHPFADSLLDQWTRQNRTIFPIWLYRSNRREWRWVTAALLWFSIASFMRGNQDSHKQRSVLSTSRNQTGNSKLSSRSFTKFWRMSQEKQRKSPSSEADHKA